MKNIMNAAMSWLKPRARQSPYRDEGSDLHATWHLFMLLVSFKIYKDVEEAIPSVGELESFCQRMKR